MCVHMINFARSCGRLGQITIVRRKSLGFRFCSGSTPGTSKRKGKTKVNDGINAIIGSVTGILGSLCGVGGGIVIIPALKQFSKLNLHAIIGTSLVAVTGSSFCASIAYVESGTADVGVALLMGVSAVLAAK